MRNLISRAHAGLSWLAVAAIVAQFFFAGLGIFGAAGFRAHTTTGYLIALVSLLILVLALAGRLGRMRIGFSGLLVGLTLVQVLLPKGPPLIAALHPLNALLVLGVTVNLARLGTKATAQSQPAAPAAGMTESSVHGGHAI